MRLSRSLLLASFFAAGSLYAQPGSGSIVYIFEAGAAVSATHAGLGLIGGVARRTAHFSLGASIEMIVTPGGGRANYQNDQMLDETSCRNRQRGQEVAKLICSGVSATPAVLGSLEATPLKSIPVAFGLGYRLGESYGPVATMALSAQQARSRNRIRFVMMAGPSYFAARFGVMIPER
jgi:hypothetical protein